MDPYPLSVLAESHTLRGIGLSQCLETPGGTTPSQLGTLIVKKLFNALDSPPQGVCWAAYSSGFHERDAPPTPAQQGMKYRVYGLAVTNVVLERHASSEICDGVYVIQDIS